MERRKTDKVTVIVPNWNYAMFLPECLDSILAQTVLPHRIIVADDASTDKSKEIAMELGARIQQGDFGDLEFTFSGRFVRRGTIENENDAAKLVETPWMFFLDADDKIEPTYVEKAVGVIDSHDDRLAIVYADMMKFGNWSGAWQVSDWDPVALRTGNYINGHSLVRADLFRRIGGLKDNGNFEDHQMWVDILDLNEGYYGVRIPEPLVWYRRHDFGHRTDRSDITTRENMR